MKSGNSNNSTFGIRFSGLLTIAFIILKLTNVITWSQWWVLAPIWISFGLMFLIFIFAIIITIY